MSWAEVRDCPRCGGRLDEQRVVSVTVIRTGTMDGDDERTETKSDADEGRSRWKCDYCGFQSAVYGRKEAGESAP